MLRVSIAGAGSSVQTDNAFRSRDGRAGRASGAGHALGAGLVGRKHGSSVRTDAADVRALVASLAELKN